ncbi:Xin actin-binding repeat-containing protein 1 [Acipenser ruthenus]|uniref:Xin actin-binding repeat-containing protein 1 n=1 Tax=Acipenser ruthenus TaxID=7906 RepID=A0A662YNC5_ACIRT|nr:Xin actin-binding repeat-containing protein 1 [Acipenser ruthenus]
MDRMSNLRRAQSLRNVSVDSTEDSKGKTIKSVSQLVAKYQSSIDLRNAGSEEEKQNIVTRDEPVETKMEALMKRFEKREKPRSSPAALSNLSRSKSMESLPRQGAGTAIDALRAIFEVNVIVKKGSSSSPRRSQLQPDNKTKGSAATFWNKAPGPEEINKTQTRRAQEEECIKNVSIAGDRTVEAAFHCLYCEKRPSISEPRATSCTADQDLDKPVPSVKERSARYLSRTAAVSPRASPVKPMAENTKQTQVSKTTNGHSLEEDLPPPSPPGPQQEALAPTEEQDPSFIPVPPPKETFCTFYQQQQKNELKRLYRHMHPELRNKLEVVVSKELEDMMNSDQIQALAAAEAGLQGEVQSMRWIFENWKLDSIGEHHATKKMLEDETVPGGNVKGTSSLFEHQSEQSTLLSTSKTACENEQIKGAVHTATWLFETQPLDCLNKLYPEEGEMVEVVLKEPMQRGDVKGARLLFESCPLDALGRCNSVEDRSILKLRSEIQEQKGDVQKTLKLFQTEPCCAIRDGTGNIYEIKSICREEIQSDSVKTARWLFETQPLDLINRDRSEVRIIRGISLEEAQKGGVDKKRWMFETQSLDTIHESIQEEKFQASTEVVERADVDNKRILFETQPLAALKGECSKDTSSNEEIVGGDVRSTMWLFETQPMENLKDRFEVGRLKKVTVTEDERGTVKERKEVFETRPLDSICKEASHEESSSNGQEIEKGDVKSYKHLFETIPLSSISHTESESIVKQEELMNGNVKDNRALFETNPLYAIKDSTGNYHEVTTVSREQVINGNVQNYKWMFETRYLDQFEEGAGKVEIIKGITRQEVQAGDVKTAKWLFETQPLGCIHNQINPTAEHSSVKKEVSEKGNVRTCRWLFETQPMDILYEKSEMKQEETIPKADVKSHTWLFETQPLDAIKETSEQYLKVCNVYQDDVKTVDVKTVKHLFETESLDSLAEQGVRYVSKVDVQSGDVSRVKEIFETKSLDTIGTASVKITEAEDKDESIQSGSVHKFTWLFENRPIDTIKEVEETSENRHVLSDVKGGDVGNKKFIFETFSLDQIPNEDNVMEYKSVPTEVLLKKGDVKSCTMLFETQPLYAIRDKEGQFHEVTTVKKEEVMSGDVRGARWMFETKPLDAIKQQDEIFVIRAVTQEDIQKGDVKTARWRFETQPLDSLTTGEKPPVKTVEDVQEGDVQLNKQLFESQDVNQKKYVRMVSVSDVQQGDVRTSTWLFENHPIDTLKGEFQESVSVQTVHREDNQKGDVKRSTWLFETQPLDALKESEPSVKIQEEMPRADVKSTTWLFESTPLDKLSSVSTTETMEMVVESVRKTLHCLYNFNAIRSHGIVIEANKCRSVKMAKYQLIESQGPVIQKEEVVEGDIKGIMLQLLHRTNVEPQGILVKEDEQGNVQVTQLELCVSQQQSSEKTEGALIKTDVAQAIDNLLSQDTSVTKGILIQETERGHAEMTIYSLFSHQESRAESQEIVKGNVKSTIGSLLATTQEHKTAASVRLGQSEKGNVHLYRSCIEKGDLNYLKNLQEETCEDDTDSPPKEQIEIVQGDVEGAKRHLHQHKEQVEKSVKDIVPGNIKSTKQVFLSENVTEQSSVQKEEILRGDITAAKQSLGQAMSQPIVVEKEEIVSGDIKATLQSLERAKIQSKQLEREIIVPGTIYDITVPLEETGSTTNGNEAVVLVTGDTCAEKHGIEQGNQAATCLVMEDAHSSDLQAAMQSLRQATAEAKTVQHHVQERHHAVSQAHREQHTQHVAQQKTSVQHARTVQTSMQMQETVEQKTQLSSVTRVEESTCDTVSSKSQQKITATQQKVSDSVAIHPIGACQQSEVAKSADNNIYDGVSQPLAAVVNPFINSDYDVQSSQEKLEQEIAVRGDVKAAIKSLQNAAAEQRPVDKEDVVRGDLHATLQSLEKSSINVSKGDYKAAMIYKNARQSYSVGTKKNDTESVVVSVPPSDTELPPPVAVTDREWQPSTTCDATVTHTCKENKTNDSTNSSTLAKQRVSQIPPPLPPKTCEKAPSPKPAVPPKPEHLAAGSSAAQAKRPSPPPKHLREDQLAPIIPPKAQRQLSAKSTPPPLPPKPSCYQETTMTKSVETSENESFRAEVSRNSKHMEMHCEASGVQCVIGSAAVSTKKVIKTPLQLAEEKYKHRKEGQSKDNTSNKELTQKSKPSTVNPETRGEVTEKIEHVPHKTQATEEMQGFMPSYSDDSTTANEMHQSFQTALKSFGGRKTGSVHVSPPAETNKGVFVTAPALPKKVKISQANAANRICKSEGKRCTEQEESITQQTYNQALQRTTEDTSSKQGSKIQSEIHTPSVQVNFNCQPEEQIEQQENKVVLRKKKTGRETEDERRQRLSFHRDEIIRGNVSAAMDIFENLKKREELQIILSKVEEFEGETFKVDVRSLKNLFENVPEWIVVPSDKVRKIKPKEQKKVERIEPKKDDTESASSVELVFEDLERASAEIIHLKEQTLARLMDIEESIRKALFSVSNLKSESDIAGLSGLFKESLGTEQCSSSSSNIRKISISTSKAKTENTKQVSGRNREEDVVLRGKSEQVQKPTLEIPTSKPRASSPSSPSYISIQSAARKTKVAPSEKQGKEKASPVFPTQVKKGEELNILGQVKQTAAVSVPDKPQTVLSKSGKVSAKIAMFQDSTPTKVNYISPSNTNKKSPAKNTPVTKLASAVAGSASAITPQSVINEKTSLSGKKIKSVNFLEDTTMQYSMVKVTNSDRNSNTEYENYRSKLKTNQNNEVDSSPAASAPNKEPKSLVSSNVKAKHSPASLNERAGLFTEPEEKNHLSETHMKTVDRSTKEGLSYSSVQSKFILSEHITTTTTNTTTTKVVETNQSVYNKEETSMKHSHNEVNRPAVCDESKSSFKRKTEMKTDVIDTSNAELKDTDSNSAPEGSKASTPEHNSLTPNSEEKGSIAENNVTNSMPSVYGNSEKTEKAAESSPKKIDALSTSISKGKENGKTHVRKESWSKTTGLGKSPFLKLFNPASKDNMDKKEQTEGKKPEAKPRSALGKLFQSSSEQSKESKKERENETNSPKEAHEKAEGKEQAEPKEEILCKDNTNVIPAEEHEHGRSSVPTEAQATLGIESKQIRPNIDVNLIENTSNGSSSENINQCRSAEPLLAETETNVKSSDKNINNTIKSKETDLSLSTPEEKMHTFDSNLVKDVSSTSPPEIANPFGAPETLLRQIETNFNSTERNINNTLTSMETGFNLSISPPDQTECSLMSNSSPVETVNPFGPPEPELTEDVSNIEKTVPSMEADINSSTHISDQGSPNSSSPSDTTNPYVPLESVLTQTETHVRNTENTETLDSQTETTHSVQSLAFENAGNPFGLENPSAKPIEDHLDIFGTSTEPVLPNPSTAQSSAESDQFNIFNLNVGSEQPEGSSTPFEPSQASLLQAEVNTITLDDTLDIFSTNIQSTPQSNVDLFGADFTGLDSFSGQPSSSFPEDIFGVGDFSMAGSASTETATQAISTNNFDDIFGLEQTTVSNPSVPNVQGDIFSDDIFGSQFLIAPAQPTTENVLDGLLDPVVDSTILTVMADQKNNNQWLDFLG